MEEPFQIPPEKIQPEDLSSMLAAAQIKALKDLAKKQHQELNNLRAEKQELKEMCQLLSYAASSCIFNNTDIPQDISDSELLQETLLFMLAENKEIDECMPFA